MPRLELFPFRYRDKLTGKWVRARYVAERHEIAARYTDTEWEIIGPPEIRDVDPDAGYRNFRLSCSRILPSRQRSDGLEAFLVTLFIRRYVTYCARRDGKVQHDYFEVCPPFPFRAVEYRFQRRGPFNEFL